MKRTAITASVSACRGAVNLIISCKEHNHLMHRAAPAGRRRAPVINSLSVIHVLIIVHSVLVLWCAGPAGPGGAVAVHSTPQRAQMHELFTLPLRWEASPRAHRRPRSVAHRSLPAGARLPRRATVEPRGSTRSRSAACFDRQPTIAYRKAAGPPARYSAPHMSAHLHAIILYSRNRALKPATRVLFTGAAGRQALG